MALKSLNHWILHNDTLAQEYDDILRLTPFYNPVRLAPGALDLTLYAPLVNGVIPLAGGDVTFSRNSQAIYRAPSMGKLLMATDDESRHEYTRQDGSLGYLAEFAITNKCLNYNANPDPALTNIDFITEPIGDLSRVQDTAELTQAGLNHICTSGYAIKLDNSAGVSNAAFIVLGSSGNTNTHTISAWCRIDPASTGNVRFLFAGGSGPLVTSLSYERYITSRSGSTSSRIQFTVEPGGIGYLILNQNEEMNVPSSPIVTLGDAVSRSVDQLAYSLISTPSGDPILNQAEGMHAIIWRPDFEKEDIQQADLTQYITSMDTALLFLQNTGANGEFRARSGASTDISISLPAPLTRQAYVVAMRWNGTDWTVGMKAQGVWYWGATAGTFAGLNESGLIHISDFIMGSALGPANCRKLAIWNKDLGQQVIEDFYAGDAN